MKRVANLVLTKVATRVVLKAVSTVEMLDVLKVASTVACSADDLVGRKGQYWASQRAVRSVAKMVVSWVVQTDASSVRN